MRPRVLPIWALGVVITSVSRRLYMTDTVVYLSARPIANYIHDLRNTDTAFSTRPPRAASPRKSAQQEARNRESGGRFSTGSRLSQQVGLSRRRAARRQRRSDHAPGWTTPKQLQT